MKSLQNSRRTARLAGFGALAIAAVVAVLVFTGGPGHKLKILVPASTNIVKGVPLNTSGGAIGSVQEIKPVDGGREAELTVSINDDHWPLPTDSRIDLRQGGTISFSNRYLLVDVGTSSKTYAQGDTIPISQTGVPVEIDQLINAVDSDVQAGMKNFWDEAAPNMKELSGPLREALPKIGPVAQGGADVFEQIAADQEALGTLVVSANNVTKAIDAADPDLRQLLSGAATTFDAIGNRSTELQAGLERLPAAMDDIQSFLEKANPAVQNVDAVTQALKPAIPELRKTAPLLTTALNGLGDTLPIGTEALTHAVGADRVSDVFIKLDQLTPRLTSTLDQLDTALNCIRPYSPEIAALGMNWGGFLSQTDSRDHIARAQVQNFIPAAAPFLPYGPGEVKDLFPGLRYGLPRPPGNLAGQNWFQPKCNAGPDQIDPAKDFEAKVFKGNIGESEFTR